MSVATSSSLKNKRKFPRLLRIVYQQCSQNTRGYFGSAGTAKTRPGVGRGKSTVI